MVLVGDLVDLNALLALRVLVVVIHAQELVRAGTYEQICLEPAPRAIPGHLALLAHDLHADVLAGVQPEAVVLILIDEFRLTRGQEAFIGQRREDGGVLRGVADAGISGWFSRASFILRRLAGFRFITGGRFSGRFLSGFGFIGGFRIRCVVGGGQRHTEGISLRAGALQVHEFAQVQGDDGTHAHVRYLDADIAQLAVVLHLALGVILAFAAGTQPIGGILLRALVYEKPVGLGVGRALGLAQLLGGEAELLVFDVLGVQQADGAAVRHGDEGAALRLGEGGLHKIAVQLVEELGRVPAAVHRRRLVDRIAVRVHPMGEQNVFADHVGLFPVRGEHAPQDGPDCAVLVRGIRAELHILPGLLLGLIALQLIGERRQRGAAQAAQENEHQNQGDPLHAVTSLIDRLNSFGVTRRSGI